MSTPCRHAPRYAALAAATLVAACVTPTYVDEGAGEAGAELPGAVVYRVHDAYRSAGPKCVAVLPFTTPDGGRSEATDIRLDQAETVRRAVYAHLAPQGKRDVELPRIDHVLATRLAGRHDLAAVGETLHCEAVIRGRVTEYGSRYLGVYSHVGIGAELEMVRTADGTVLWHGRHVAETHGGTLPLSPIGLAMGAVDAAFNVREEQLFRVIDDLARRLVATIPDDTVAVLDDPVPAAVPPLKFRERLLAAPVEAFVDGTRSQPAEIRRATLVRAIDERLFGDAGTERLFAELKASGLDDAGYHARYAAFQLARGDYERALEAAAEAVAAAGDEPEHHFLEARVLIKLDRIDDADAAIVRAIALDDAQADYFNALGYLNAVRGRDERALAAYRMGIERRPANGFAYYNMGVIFHARGDLENAADAFYGAGLAYLKADRYGEAAKALADLVELADRGVARDDEIATLRRALERMRQQATEERHA